MNEMNLSKRLHTVASFIPNGSTIADIGSDHAYLPCFVCLNGIASFAIAGEVNEGPYQLAMNQVKSSGLEDKISVRKGNGLEVIKKGEVDCVTIAGMGGQLITSILEEGKEKLAGVKLLILQPNVGAISIRNWLIDNEWELFQESILEEDGKIYEILVAKKGDAERAYSEHKEAALLMGPFLMKERNQVFRKKWNLETEKWRMILSQLKQADKADEVIDKRKKTEHRIQMVEEVLYEIY